MGYHRAGFDVVGVDLEAQPNYPFPFVQADVFNLEPDELGLQHDAIHASPPCERYIRSGMFDRSRHPDLMDATRSLLRRSGLPWVIENVPGAPMHPNLWLCGCMFGLEVRRRRWFETSWPAFELIPSCQHFKPPVGVYGHPRGRGLDGDLPWGWGTFEDWQRAMQINWMTAAELAKAIPPAYTEHIGQMLLDEMRIVSKGNYPG